MSEDLPDDDDLYAALIARDPAFERRAYVGVTTTGIFCRLTCPARKPKRANTVFFADTGAAVEAGFRPCLRCRPLCEEAEPAVAALLDRVDGGRVWSERAVAAAGFDPSTVRRAFRRRFGTTFLAMDRSRRVARGVDAITSGARIIDGQLDAGFASSSGFRAAVARSVGTCPAAIRSRDRPPTAPTPTTTGPLPHAKMRKDVHMPDRSTMARRFAALHVRGEPLVLYNIWDAGSARAVAEAGAGAVATGSWSLAAAQGYADGEAIPLDVIELIVGRIVASVDLPVSVDIEGGYAIDPRAVADNVRRIVALGAVGINIEDGIVGADAPALHEVALQCERIRAIRAMAEHAGVPLFVNARTDLFLQAPPADHVALVAPALERATAYAQAGADGFFVPGLVDEASIAQICEDASLPVNVMVRDGLPPTSQLAALGVARISHGPGPYRVAMAELAARAANHL